MKYCWSTKRGNILIIPYAIFIALLLYYQNWTPPMITLAALFCPIAGYFANVSLRKYSISHEGLSLRCLIGKKKSYQWEELSEVALCKVHYATSSERHELAIRCVIGEEKEGPKKAHSAKEPWQTMEYEVRNHRKVVSIYYTEERYAEFQEYCPLPIKDYTYLKVR